MGNPFCHMELITSDPKGARKFYQELFDWQFNDMESGGTTYTMIDPGSEPKGGIMATPEPGIHTTWSIYIEVQDIKAACAKVEQLGGKVWKPVTEVPEYGFFAVVCDPQGAYFCLWQNK